MIDRSHLDKGEFVIFELMCESCTFNTLGPLNCKKYINGKPNEVLKCTSKCSEYNMVNNVAMAGIIGAVVGDALGVPVEFTAREKLSLKPVIDMNEYGTHNQPKGTWSDDSSLILALIAGLREREYTFTKYSK